jgi:hypothetical protein
MSKVEGRGRTGDGLSRVGTLAPLAVAAGALFLAAAGTGCGSGGGPSPKPADSANLYVKSFSAPNYSGIFLDEDLQFVLSAPVLDESINPDSIQMRTGPSGGTAPFGTFVRGVFYVDPSTGTRIVVDPQFVSPSLVNLLENGKRDYTRIPANARIDLGNDEPPESNGGRLVLFDRTQKDVVTFIPEIPTRAALDDTGYTPGANYTVVVPGYPATNTLENLAGDQLLSPNNRIFTSSFRVISSVAPQLFIGSESAGIPRVIFSAPYNGADEVPVTSTIAIDFSQALDPRTVTPDKFKVELVSVPAPYPQIPVSVFLAQQRLGKIEVILTPINPMPADSTIRVTLDSGIEDLLGQALNQSTISFFTGFGPPTGCDCDPLEEFDDISRQDGLVTTANWANSRPYVGGVAGQLTAAFAPYAGDGTDGAFNATIGQTTTLQTGTTAQRVYNFTTFTIPIGATVVAAGSYPLVLQCQDAVDVSGTLRLDGSAGGNGFRGDSTSAGATGGAGGIGGPGGNPGGDGAFKTIGSGGNFDGLDGQGLTPGSAGIGGNTGENDGGTVAPSSWLTNSPAGATTPFWPRPIYTVPTVGPSQCGAGNVNCSNPPKSYDPVRQREGGGGGGGSLAGGNSDNRGITLIQRAGESGSADGGYGGGTWGSSTFAGADLGASVKVKDPASPPNGLRTIFLTNIPTLTAGMGGAGGGGGGGEDDSQGDSVHWGAADGSDEGGGGGGGGGGALQIRTFTTINVAGTISCKGGAGGGSYDDTSLTQFSQGAGGGGGSGGAVWLQCRGSMSIQGGAVIDVDGGVGGQGLADGTTTIYNGGLGAPGRILIEDADGAISNAPAASVQRPFAPSQDLDSTAVSEFQNTFIFDPDYSSPVVDADVFPALPNNGTIKIYMEGAPENVSTGVDDPDTNNTTGWILVWDSTAGGDVPGDPTAAMDAAHSKWWRFRVDFTVSALHLFTDPMPTVRSIQFKIAQ